MKLVTILGTMILVISAQNAVAAGWRHSSGADGNYIYTAANDYSAPTTPHLIIWCNPEGFDVSLSPHELVGNGKDVRALADLNLDKQKMKSTWGISTSNNALFIERIGNKKIDPVEFIAMLFKHNTISVDYGAIEGSRYTKRHASFSMAGARSLFQTACRP